MQDLQLEWGTPVVHHGTTTCAPNMFLFKLVVVIAAASYRYLVVLCYES